ncbi:MAG: hypothetical protein AB7K04_11870 [Pseudorhodoplanes sp.]
MQPLHAFLLGLLAAWIPCLLALGWMLWRAPLSRWNNDAAREGYATKNYATKRGRIPTIRPSF